MLIFVTYIHINIKKELSCHVWLYNEQKENFLRHKICDNCNIQRFASEGLIHQGL